MEKARTPEQVEKVAQEGAARLMAERLTEPRDLTSPKTAEG